VKYAHELVDMFDHKRIKERFPEMGEFLSLRGGFAFVGAEPNLVSSSRSPRDAALWSFF